MKSNRYSLCPCISNHLIFQVGISTFIAISSKAKLNICQNNCSLNVFIYNVRVFRRVRSVGICIQIHSSMHIKGPDVRLQFLSMRLSFASLLVMILPPPANMTMCISCDRLPILSTSTICIVIYFQFQSQAPTERYSGIKSSFETRLTTP